MPTSRFLIGPFRAENVNLSGSDFVAGLPNPSAALGFVGAIAMDLGLETWDHKAILVVHDLMERPGRLRGEQQRKAKRTMPLEIPEYLTGHGVFSIIAEFPAVFSVNDVAKSFERKRFAGGAIFPPAGRAMKSLVSRVSNEDLEQKLRSLPRGYILAPAVRVKDCDIVSFGEAMSLERIAMRSFDPEEKKKGGYVVPVACGYRVLKETFRDCAPSKSRDKSLPFAMVDGAVGLGHFISVRNQEAFNDIEEMFQKGGWSWSCSADGTHKMLSEFHLQSVI